jgi:hypothetical protein
MNKHHEWRGDMSFVEAQRIGVAIDGPKGVDSSLSEVVRSLSVRQHRTSRAEDG